MILSLSFIGATYAAVAGDWGYKENGRDWPNLKIESNSCANTMQSPIDLPTNMEAFKTIPFKEDRLNKIYTNPKNVDVKWTGKTSYIGLPENDINLYHS